MSLPGYSAEVSMYSSTHHYRSSWAFGRTAAGPARAHAAALPLPNGGPVCKPHIGPCNIPDPDCPKGMSRFILGSDCEGDTFCCTPPCPTTCGPCTGGSCGPYPTCGPIAGSGTKSCTDCHGIHSTQHC
jgi:hypothetical protein